MPQRRRRTLTATPRTAGPHTHSSLDRRPPLLDVPVMAAWSRSAARRLGRWTVQPSRWCSTAHTQAGWWRTPVSARSPARSAPASTAPRRTRWRSPLQQSLLDGGELSMSSSRWVPQRRHSPFSRLRGCAAGASGGVPIRHRQGVVMVCPLRCRLLRQGRTVVVRSLCIRGTSRLRGCAAAANGGGRCDTGRAWSSWPPRG